MRWQREINLKFKRKKQKMHNKPLTWGDQEPQGFRNALIAPYTVQQCESTQKIPGFTHANPFKRISSFRVLPSFISNIPKPKFYQWSNHLGRIRHYLQILPHWKKTLLFNTIWQWYDIWVQHNSMQLALLFIWMNAVLLVYTLNNFLNKDRLTNLNQEKLEILRDF